MAGVEMKYTVAMSARLRDFTHIVETYIEMGFKPVGGISVADGWYHQAMVRDDETREDQTSQAEGAQGHQLASYEAARKESV